MDFFAQLAIAVGVCLLGMLFGLKSVSKIVLVPRSQRPRIIGITLVAGILATFTSLCLGRILASNLFVLSERGGEIVYSFWGYFIAGCIGFGISWIAAAFCGYAMFDRRSDAGHRWPFQEF